MKSKVKSYKLIIWLSQLNQTLIDVRNKLKDKQDEIAKELWLEKFIDGTEQLTEEIMKTEEYQTKVKQFGEKLQAEILDKEYSLEPMGPFIIDDSQEVKDFIAETDLTAEDFTKLKNANIFILS